MFTRAWAIDAAERIAATYVEAFLVLLAAGWTDKVDLSIFATALWAAVPAALATAKALVAQLRGDPDTASLTRQGQTSVADLPITPAEDA